MATEDKEHGAREADGAAPEGASSETHDLPALIDSAPTAPVPVERLAAQPEDAFERFAFTLWNAGRKEEAVELLERQIAKQKADKAAAAAPPLWAISRPLVAAAALVAIAAGIVWTGYDRIAALPQWVASFQTFDSEAPDAADLAAASETTPARLPRPRADPASEPEMTSALAAPSGDGDTPDNSAPPAEPVPFVETVAAAGASDMARAAAFVQPAPAPEETPKAPDDVPPPETTASVAVSDMARAAGAATLAMQSEPSTADESSAPPEEEVVLAETVGDAGADTAPVTLRSLAGRGPAAQPVPPEDASVASGLAGADFVETVGGPRLPRARPEPSPELVAALTAPSRDVSRVAREDGDIEPYVIRQPSRQRVEDLPERRVIVVRPNGLTILGRVRPVPPGLAMQREHAERYIARRRAAERAWQNGDRWPPDAYDDEAYELYRPSDRRVYRRQLPWVPRAYIIDGY